MHIDISHLDYPEALDLFHQSIHDFAMIDLEICFLADHSQSKILRDLIGMIFENNNIDGVWKSRFVLITDELVNNAIEHGSNPGDKDLCIISSSMDEQGFSIRLSIQDTGRGKDSLGASHISEIEKQKEKEDMAGVYTGKRGRGLFFITSKLVDEMRFEDNPEGGLTVVIEKFIPIGE